MSKGDVELGKSSSELTKEVQIGSPVHRKLVSFKEPDPVIEVVGQAEEDSVIIDVVTLGDCE